jgi:hypothetical protein
MKKIKDILSIVTSILAFIIFIFYRYNNKAICIVAALLWINVIITILRKNTLPKPDYYIYKPVIAKYLRLAMVSICIMAVIKWVVLIVNKGFYKEFDGFIIAFIPLILLNFLNDDRKVYFYDKGLVWHGEVLEFSNINLFEWKEDGSYKLNIYYENTEYNVKVPKTKFEYVDKTLKANINL